MGRKLVFLVMLCAAMAGAQQPSAAPSKASSSAADLPGKATVESFLKHWFGYDPSITTEVDSISPSEVPGVAQVVITLAQGSERRNMVLYIMPDRQHAIAGEAQIIPFGAEPFQRPRQLLAASTTGIARGPEHASVTIVEFSDLQCPHCKAAQPTLDRLLADFPNARFVFQQFPLETVHPWALKAAEWAQCIGRENNQAFSKFVQSVYDDQLNIDAQNADAKLREHAVSAGAPAEKTAACVASPETARQVEQSIELGRSVGVTGTPTVFINGRKVVSAASLPYETLKSLVQYAEKGD